MLLESMCNSQLPPKTPSKRLKISRGQSQSGTWGLAVGSGTKKARVRGPGFSAFAGEFRDEMDF